MEDQIPKEFYSFETDKPFEFCIECEKYLLDEHTEYIIEKAVKNYEGYSAKDVVFDYAICMDCAERMKNEVSKESWQQMIRYFQENMDVDFNLSNQHRPAAEGLKMCMIKKTEIGDCREYQIYAHCKGSKLNLNNPPYMLS